LLLKEELFLMKKVVLCCFLLVFSIFMAAITVRSSLKENPTASADRSQGTEFLAHQSTALPGHKAHGNKTKREFCNGVNSKFRLFGWNKIICNPERWKVFDYSSNGNPLLYQEFGFNDPDNFGPVNLVLCGVHGDESVGVYQCFQMVREILFDNPDVLRGFKLVIAPIVNPDGFIANTRHNANGVDPNRNLPTMDWDEMSHKVWAKYNNDPRKYPGEESGSEIESKFQVHLVNTYKPDKIISFHSPLGLLDFDGPGDQKYYNLVRVEHRAKYTKRSLRLVDFPFFPGSLGNYAGNERKIPTYTVELETSDPAKGHAYWSIMRFALVKALSFAVYDKNEKNPFLTAQYLFQQSADSGVDFTNKGINN
jgi:protein MpaA